MSNFKFQKTLLAVSATAAMACSFGTGHAQAVRDSGQLNFVGQISATTCVLSLGDTASTTAGSKTVNLGTYTTASTSGMSAGTSISSPSLPGINLSLKDSGGVNPCALPGTTKWDIGVDLPATAYTTTAIPGTTALINQAPAAVAATNVALRITRGVNGGSAVLVDFATKANAAYGTLITGSTEPLLGASDFITIFALLQKSGTGPVTPGAFSASIPLLVWYK
jgi:type 1 fimbria pilin